MLLLMLQLEELLVVLSKMYIIYSMNALSNFVFFFFSIFPYNSYQSSKVIHFIDSVRDRDRDRVGKRLIDSIQIGGGQRQVASAS